jgi:hypothetical protein
VVTRSAYVLFYKLREVDDPVGSEEDVHPDALPNNNDDDEFDRQTTGSKNQVPVDEPPTVTDL